MKQKTNEEIHSELKVIMYSIFGIMIMLIINLLILIGWL